MIYPHDISPKKTLEKKGASKKAVEVVAERVTRANPPFRSMMSLTWTIIPHWQMCHKKTKGDSSSHFWITSVLAAIIERLTELKQRWT